jgi:hypothetical protein
MVMIDKVGSERDAKCQTVKRASGLDLVSLSTTEAPLRSEQQGRVNWMK